MSRTLFYLLCLPAIYLLGCKSQSKEILLDLHLDSQIKEIIEGAINKAGGFGVWQNLAKIKFDKVTELYDSLGHTELRTDQHHRYHIRPKHILEIIWQDSTGNHQLMLRNNQLEKYVNGSEDPDIDSTAGHNMLLSAEYAALLPFKLLDIGLQFYYEGTDTLSGKNVHIVRTEFPGNSDNKNVSSDIWWHYFNTRDYTHEGYLVKHADHFSLVINEDFAKDERLILPSRRSSYRVDSAGNYLYKRADYWYDNYHMRFSEPQ